MDNKLIYLDNAATSFPKPRKVIDRMVETYTRLGVSPGRGSYDLSMEAADLVFQTRQKLARFFGAPDPERVIFAANATDALNLAILGLVRPGDHVITTRLEHNSVLRPLFHLAKQSGIEYDLVGFDEHGYINLDEIASTIRSNTRLVICNHASNVLGTVQPVSDIARACVEREIPLLIDAAQSAGYVPIDMSKWNVNAIAFTGHKALLGPSGIGGLVLSPHLEIKSTRFGGTGIDSRTLIHTQTFPHRLEAGTLNLLGVFGLLAGLDYLENEDMERGHQKEMAMIKRLYEGLSLISRVVIHSPMLTEQDVPVLTCSVKGLSSEDVGAIMDGDYGIAVRTGLHCAPLVHVDLGTDTNGAIRFSLGRFNTNEDIDRALEAMDAISSGR
ncbi:aminotransferase class V-fold PLP-dependent enzyme [Desulfoscipio gibsoniae]|uniref:cysteine desulfurase n=1 Tax=Desulfoscipio gibsoniae DSM 7213 TaxID=767817 RepID=R4KKL0_9FIRM|nr:aminotransferase class V-fold PLP-dependent enzyme [Desulfoscipio gibsoniae]AGL03199.1 cysteine desulfurase family protein [Desulfoscipio gibsoniae DSM 7213]